MKVLHSQIHATKLHYEIFSLAWLDGSTLSWVTLIFHHFIIISRTYCTLHSLKYKICIVLNVKVILNLLISAGYISQHLPLDLETYKSQQRTRHIGSSVGFRCVISGVQYFEGEGHTH